MKNARCALLAMLASIAPVFAFAGAVYASGLPPAPPAAAPRPAAEIPASFRLSLHDFQRNFIGIFEAIDLNGDQKITRAEAMADLLRGSFDPQVPSALMGIIDTMDADQDGMVTLEEFLRPPTDVFLSADRNNDGYLDPVEVRALTGNSLSPEQARMATAISRSPARE